jgi:hypothetical protein
LGASSASSLVRYPKAWEAILVEIDDLALATGKALERTHDIEGILFNTQLGFEPLPVWVMRYAVISNRLRGQVRESADYKHQEANIDEE